LLALFDTHAAAQVTTPAGVEYLMHEKERNARQMGPPPRTTDEFVSRFHESAAYRAMEARMQEPAPRTPWLAMQQQEFSNGWLRSTWLCLRRQARIAARDRVFLRSRLLGVTVMGLMAGTLFYQLERDEVYDKVCLMFFSLMFTALGSMATIPTVMEQRAVFYKQRDAGFFPTSSAVVAQMLVQVPLQLLETLLFSSLVYFLSGMSRASHGAHFGAYMLVVLCTALAMGQLFRLIGESHLEL
jgi:hypothetical protein